MAMIEPTPNEQGDAPNVFDMHSELQKISKAFKPGSLSDALAFRAKDSKYNAEFEAFYQKAEMLRQVAKKHSWTRATVSAVARATVGAGFNFVRHPVYGKNRELTQEQMDQELEDIYDFFYGVNDQTKYIQDITTLPAKIYYTVTSLVYYGQIAWEIITDKAGKPIGFDPLAGIVRPNVDEKGKFLRPAYYFRPWNSQSVVSFNDPNSVLFITWPGIDMSIFGSSEYEAVADISIPSDLYASTAYRNHFENINAPYNGVWIVDKNTNKDDYKQFLMTLVNRYSGVVNYGRTPLVIKGDVEFKETRSRSNDDAPYLEGRKYNQEEISAVSAVPSAKVGLAANSTRTNFREQRRDFHENTLRPIFEIIEHAVYQQIFVRGFGIKQWMLSFNSPDLTTALEAATINTRYVQNGVLNINEVRQDLGYTPRTDPFGTTFYHPSNSAEAVMAMAENRTEPDGGSTRQSDMARVPSQDNAHTGQENVPREERQQVFMPDKILSELKSWKNFAIRVAEGRRNERPFYCQNIPSDMAEQIQNALNVIGENADEVRDLFSTIINDVSDLT